MTRHIAQVVSYDWYWAAGAGIDEAVVAAVDWYNEGNEKPANFVQLCSADYQELGLNGRLRGVSVFRRSLCGERGNIMVGRMERA